MNRSFARACAVLIVMSSLATARGQGFVWLEGEQPTTKNIEIKAEAFGRTELLAGGKWLKLQVEQQDLAKKLPKEGALLGYQFQVSAAGNYEVWSPHRLRGRPLALRVADRPGRMAAGQAVRSEHRPDRPGHLEPRGMAEAGKGRPRAGQARLRVPRQRVVEGRERQAGVTGHSLRLRRHLPHARPLPAQREVQVRRGLAE